MKDFVCIKDHVGWSVGFGLLAGMVAMGLAIFLMGLKVYRRQGPLGSPFTRVAQVFVAAARKWRAEEAGEGRDVRYYDEDEQSVAREGGRNEARCLARTPQFRYVGFRFPFLDQRGPWNRFDSICARVTCGKRDDQ